MATIQELQDQVNALSEQLLKLSTVAYDATRHFGNMEQVASSGKAGALSLADTLSSAPVGDAATVRGNINAQEAGKCVAMRDNVVALGMGSGNREYPYVLLSDGTSELLATRGFAASRTLEELPVGTAWKLRQNIGLGNDDAGRANIGAVAARESVIGVGLGGSDPQWPYFLRDNGQSVALATRALVEGMRAVNAFGATVAVMMKEWGNRAPGSTSTAAELKQWGAPGTLDGTWLMLCVQWVTEAGKAIITYVRVS